MRLQSLPTRYYLSDLSPNDDGEFTDAWYYDPLTSTSLRVMLPKRIRKLLEEAYSLGKGATLTKIQVALGIGEDK